MSEVQISQEQIAQVVDAFYNKVQNHAQLAEPFRVVQDWPRHKAIISHFWWLTLGGERYMDYAYHVVPKHREVGFTPELLNEHWLPLFESTMHEFLDDARCAIWMTQARRIGGSLHLMHQYWQDSQSERSHDERFKVVGQMVKDSVVKL